MFTKLGKLTTRHPIAVIVTWIVLAVVSGIAILSGFGAGGLFERMHSDGFAIPGSESQTVSDLTGGDEESGETTVIVVEGFDLTDAETFRQVESFANEHRELLEVEGIASVTDPFAAEALTAEMLQTGESSTGLDTEAGAESTEANDVEAASAAALAGASSADLASLLALVAEDGTSYVLVVEAADGQDEAAQTETQTRLMDALSDYQTALQAEFSGATASGYSETLLEDSIVEQIQSDLVVGEGIGLPVAAILMMIVFAGVVAALLPLIGALGSIILGMAVMWIATLGISVDSFTLNVVSVVGVALSVDYGLLIVSRFREEAGLSSDKLHAEMSHLEVEPVIERTVATAGRTVTFSAITIAFALAGLMFLGVHTMRVISLATVAVTVLALLAAITLVPALLTLVGKRLLKPSPLTKVPGLRQIMGFVGHSSDDQGVFSRLALRVQKRPWLTMIGCLAVLVVMSLPLAQMQVRNNFADYMEEGSSLEQAYQTMQSKYPQLATPSIIVAADAPADSDAVSALAEYIESLDNVTSVTVSVLDSAGGGASADFADSNASTESAEADSSSASSSELSQLAVLIDTEDEVDKEVTSVVDLIRNYDAGVETWTGGAAASQMDFLNALVDHLPEALAFIVIAVMLLLFLMTGSILVPLKALIINSLSLCASIGVTSFLFQQGLGVPQTPGLELFIVACMVAFGFGLAMDYEVFLLARIKEFWDEGYDNDQAVAKGMQRSGRIITSAAAIIIAVFIGFSFGDLLAIKEIGVALAIMVAVDATLVRLFLVPATMTVLGKWNWWAPRPLRCLHERFGLHD